MATAWEGVADALQELLGHDVSTWEHHGLERTKERTVRSVFRGSLGSTPAHIKVFRADKLSDLAREALRGQRGSREAAHLLRARALGLPAVEPLAYGMAVDGATRRSFVVTRTVEDARTFDFGLGEIVLTRAGALLRRVHDAGVLASDLHPGNLLVDGLDQAQLIDLTNFRHGGELTLSQRAAALALFCQPLDGGALDRGAQTLLRAYRDAGPPLPDRFAEQLAAATRRRRAAALPAFGRRSQRNCRHTELEPRRRAEPQWFWHLGDTAAADERDRVRDLAASPPPATKTGRRGAVWLTDRFVMKQREPGHARKLWRAAYWLLFAGIPSPRPVAMRLHRGVGLVISARVDNPPLAEELANGLEPGQILALAADLGRTVGRLHGHGLRNRDLKFDNLVRVPGTDRIAIVDLDGIRSKATTDTRGCGADLGRLLAAYRAAGAPGGSQALWNFVRAYLRSQRDLLLRPPIRRLLRRAEQRAGEWAQAHT